MGSLRSIDRRLSKGARRALYLGLGMALSLFWVEVAQAVSPDATAHSLSTGAILSIIIGAIITVFYIRGMYQVLHYASETYHLDFDIDAAGQFERSTASKILLFGSVMLVVLSALIISSYGWGSAFIYTGPILCLLGPIVVIVSMALDVKKYKQALREAALQPEEQRNASVRETSSVDL